MSKRNYNVFFNTHTVSGIVISVALYVIFFAGAFSFFKEEIINWEKGTFVKQTPKENVNYDGILNALKNDYQLEGRDILFRLQKKGEEAFISLSPSKDSLASKKAKTAAYFSLNTNTYERKSYTEFYSLGEFIYRLHFFSQLPYIGIYLAGLVSVFFLFAIVTGIIVHWKKIVSNFYTFNPKLILKRVWADAHTALGVIGLPFQLIYALTGAYFGLSILVLLPANFLYNNNQDKLLEDLRPQLKTYPWIAKTTQQIPSANDFVVKNAQRWKNTKIKRFTIKNYGGTNMKYQLMVNQSEKIHFLAQGRITIDAFTNKIEDIKAPEKEVYLENIQASIGKLHFGHYGGIGLKIIYFILALITCFVIITGVLIWLEARNKKSIPLSKRLYTNKVGHIYMAICLSLFPVIALSFIFVKLLPQAYNNDRKSLIYYFFFISWLIAIIILRYVRNNYKTNKYTLWTGGILGLLIPIINGFVTNNWIWKTYKAQQYDILTIDLLWIFLAITAIIFAVKLKPAIQEKSSLAKNPINYNEIKALKKQNIIKEQALIAHQNNNQLPMKTKIISLWMFIIFGYIFHHIYGLATVFFNQTVFIEGSDGSTPFWAHQWRILMEGTVFLFALLTIQLSKKWFKITSLIWGVIVAIFNCYHVIEEAIGHPDELSKIWILLLTAIASILLVINLNQWRKQAVNI
ncbi:PepSY-associated TM helix domain-containing protein [Tenacibaculum finnmarkense]|uniref:PepSY-associated TM helix domain-containing protein n=1 Tax=Tenacibaculum finnmarkense TaxID=2781243 RepID=UPI001EFAF446|nr:PepSY-associated TM helix domain-containing protein [Tenacibaculum finnmarkense]MCG8733242.1 PepSY domain-containing protein [Tenacibaculum finnmarkense]WCC42490.1 PepSY-associated TM helix domain-containing protein [Tenacibaculum finnmarkense]